MASEVNSSSLLGYFELPDTLYEMSVSTVANSFSYYKKYLLYLPENILFDIYYQLYKDKKLCCLSAEFSDLDIFSKMLRIGNRRTHLLQAFQALMDHGTKIGSELALNYNLRCLRLTKKPHSQVKPIINLGLRLGSFLSDAGWYAESVFVLLACKDLCLIYNDTPEYWGRTLDCCLKLLHAQAAACVFEAAAETYQLALDTVKKLKDAGCSDYNYAALYTEFSLLFFMRSEYDQTYEWSIAALKELKPTLPPRIIVDVLRQAARSCVIKREFQKADLLLRQAVYLVCEVFGTKHPKYSDVLIDYGFHLLNYDSISNSVCVTKMALAVRKKIFGKTNLHVAIAHEDLAYALYVHEYSSGRFSEAREQIERAIEIMEKVLTPDHLMLANAKRVKALILEEIALDSEPDNQTEVIEDLLLQAEALHMSALRVTKAFFGEKNVQTAKHYGNLGRLYQSMRRFQEAEEMHLKAISIKEEILGPDDYEVALSSGHLASLYNFHMERYRDAEPLYLRSIDINIKVFGKSYSGLGYDYRGLLRVYEMLHEYDKLSEYREALIFWNELRKENAQSEESPILPHKLAEPVENVIQTFFSM